MEIMMDSLKVMGRIVTILPLMLAIGLYMGKRSIGELPVIDFLTVLVLGSVVGADIADPNIQHIHTVVAIVVIAILQKVIVFIKLKKRKIGKWLTFEPTIVIYKGEWKRTNLKRIQYSIDNVLQMLREQGVFQTSEVELAIVEPNGRLSVKRKPLMEPPTREELHIMRTGNDYEVPVILDGVIQMDILRRMGKEKEWIRKQLNQQNIPHESRVFYGAMTSRGVCMFSLKDSKVDDLPPIEH
ncbi:MULTISPECIES: DUF421 domain-containing protein [Pontibacillus]|uniref:DUF421 domain-containing protein n=1 Tax=Pontibacillus chungwhensis TaxID=265426 RepID=A0ABY8UT57_9BACI|nr:MULTISPECIES: DUF421 domain-containing protein [Pontibacillus]MCD5323485.1 DUF421 domain-containing protein [Pontibacillus sp. HN14]WIF96861.1 DUF421 domain-containing protein [Pontibacillus chungwhensis]